MAIAEALSTSLAALELRPEDQAAVALAKAYAGVLDDSPGELQKTGPALLSVLESLGMTPRGRAAVVGKGVSPRDGNSKSKADELRERRAARQHASAPVDPSAS